jgi:hypothetical protein
MLIKREIKAAAKTSIKNIYIAIKVKDQKASLSQIIVEIGLNDRKDKTRQNFMRTAKNTFFCILLKQSYCVVNE